MALVHGYNLSSPMHTAEGSSRLIRELQWGNCGSKTITCKPNRELERKVGHETTFA